jgi:hypothetical protein
VRREQQQQQQQQAAAAAADLPCDELAVLGQLSHALPKASPSALVCDGFAIVGQLSFVRVHHAVSKNAPGLHAPSRSLSTCPREQPFALTLAPDAVLPHLSHALATPSPSESGSAEFRATMQNSGVRVDVAVAVDVVVGLMPSV